MVLIFRDLRSSTPRMSNPRIICIQLRQETPVHQQHHSHVLDSLQKTSQQNTIMPLNHSGFNNSRCASAAGIACGCQVLRECHIVPSLLPSYQGPFARSCLAVSMYASSHELACSPATRCLQGLGIYHLPLGLRQKRQVLIRIAHSLRCLFYSMLSSYLCDYYFLIAVRLPLRASIDVGDHVQLHLSRLHRASMVKHDERV